MSLGFETSFISIYGKANSYAVIPKGLLLKAFLRNVALVEYFMVRHWSEGKVLEKGF